MHCSSLPLHLSIPSPIRLVAVTKGRTVEDIERLIQKGCTWFGENRIQEIQRKWPLLKKQYPHVKLQFIGQLQTNKALDAMELCDSLISIDRPQLVETLSRILDSSPKNIELLIQINLAREPQKGGVSVEDLPSLLQLCHRKNLSIAGLMTIPPAGIDPTPYLTQLAQLCTSHNLKECSMGMSEDYALAISLGATQVRIGRALFT